MMYINHNSFNTSDLLTTASASSLPYHQSSVLNLTPACLTTNGTQTFNQPQLNLHSTANTKQTTTNNTNTQSLYTISQQTKPNLMQTSPSLNVSNSTSLQQQQQQQRSTSTSSSLSSASSTSTSPTSSSSALPTTAGSTQFYSKNISLNNNLYNPFNFAYYNPALSTATSQNHQSSQSLLTTTQLLPTLAASTSASNLNSSHSYAPTLFRSKDMSNGCLTTIDPNYQLNFLSSSKNPNQLQFNGKTAASNGAISNQTLVNNDTNLNKIINLNNTNSLYMLNSAKPTHQKFYTQPTYEIASSIAYLPTATANECSSLFFSNSGDQLSTSMPSYVTPSFTDMSFGSLATNSKAIVQAINSANPYTGAFGLNMKKRKRRFKKPPELRKVLPKNSLMLLHEYRPNTEYRFVSQSGPIHRPIFTMAVDINEHKFEGTGKTKKEARMLAAEKALEFLIQNPQYIQKSNKDQKSNEDMSNNGTNTDEEEDENDEESSEQNNFNENSNDGSSIGNETDNRDDVKRFKKDDSSNESNNFNNPVTKSDENKEVVSNSKIDGQENSNEPVCLKAEVN